MCQVMVAFNGQNWPFKKCHEKYFKPNFCIDICMNRIYLEYFYKIYLPCFYSQKVLDTAVSCLHFPFPVQFMWLLLKGPTGHLRSHGQRVNNL